MKNHSFSSGAFLFIFFLALVTICLISIEARSFYPSRKLVSSALATQQNTEAALTINSFEKGGGSGPSECDGQFHSDDTLIVALSTMWYNNGKRCFDYITVYGNGRSVNAMVVDECDSTRGCADDIVDGSEAVWKALGVKKNSRDWGEMKVSWSDA